MSVLERHFVREDLTRHYAGASRRCLDFACGTGRITSALSAAGFQCVGVDVSPTMLERAKEKVPGATFVNADITGESLDGAAFDVVTAFRFFGNAQDELRVRALSSLARHLNAGGILVINNHRNPLCIQARLEAWLGKRSTMDLSPEKLGNLLKSQGFEIVMTKGLGGWIVWHSLSRFAKPAHWLTRTLEILSGWLIPVNLCPNMIIVARKVRV